MKISALIKEVYAKPCVKRALRTFLQAASGYAVVHLAKTDFSAENAVWGLIMSTIAAGIAAVMNIKEKSGEDTVDKSTNTEDENNG